MPVIEKVNSIVDQLNRLFKKDPSVNLVLLNDDYVYEGIVREALMNVLGHSAQKAMELMLAAHEFGSAIVWNGDKEQAEKYSLILRSQYGLTTEVIDN